MGNRKVVMPWAWENTDEPQLPGPTAAGDVLWERAPVIPSCRQPATRMMNHVNRESQEYVLNRCRGCLRIKRIKTTQAGDGDLSESQ